MPDVERTRTREREPVSLTAYEKLLRQRIEFDERQRMGKVVIKGSSREPQANRQGLITYYLDPIQFQDTPLQDWLVFINDVRTHSGKHRHQGGLVIYVIEGKGYSVVDGERKDWEAGDLLLLPIKLGGVEHQHFNTQPGKPCRWIAFIYLPIMDQVAMELTQIEPSPDFKP
jgi:mannose-6-phosphate isomerase-like protein (cupin superfamily)